MTDHLLSVAGLESSFGRSETPATAGAPGDRTSATTEMDLDGTRTIASDIESVGASVLSSVMELRWKVGTETPPFISSNTAVVQLLKNLVDGTVVTAPKIAVSNAVAVQIYNLIYDQKAHAKELKGVHARGLYIILASLSCGSRTEPPTSNDALRLQKLLGRAVTGGREPGLAHRFRYTARMRGAKIQIFAQTHSHE